MKKLLCLLLAALLTASTLASCAKTAEGEESSTTKADTTSSDTVAESETEVQLELPDTRYDGSELVFLSREENEWSSVEIYADQPDSSSDNISTAVYERNSLLLEKFGVTINEMKFTVGEQQQKIKTEVQAPTGDFSAVTTASYIAAATSAQGYLWNLNSEEIHYLDLDKPWWDVNLNHGLSIDNRLYFSTGDILTLDNDATFAILFNKKLAKECQLPDLYQLVADKKWTMAQFYEFEQTAHNDTNGDNVLSYDEDICGYAYTSESSPICLMYAGGVVMTSKDEYDQPVYVFDVERAQNMLDICHQIFSKDHTVDLTATSQIKGIDLMEVGKTCFGENHALFLGECMQAVTRMRGFDVDFGIVPFPMFEESQEHYSSVMHATGPVVCIPRSVTNDADVTLDEVTTMLEAMAYYAQDTLTEQYYEINLKTKNAKDEQSGPMIDMILANRVFDLAYYYAWGNNGVMNMANCFLTGKTMSSRNKSVKKSCERSIEMTLKQMEKADQG